MLRAADGRLVSVRRNGFCFISIQGLTRIPGKNRAQFEFDFAQGDQFTLDFARANTLADALEQAQPCRVHDTYAQGLALQIVEPSVTEGGVRAGGLLLGKARHEPHGKPRTVSGPWPLSFEQGVQLAAEIRQAVSGEAGEDVAEKPSVQTDESWRRAWA